MLKKILPIYKVQLLISLVLTITILGINVVRNPIEIILIVMGALIGTFVLDTEYLLYAYFFEPEKDFSKTLITFMKHKDYGNAITYIDYHKNELTDRSLNSALFQVVIAGFTIFAAYSDTSYFVKALAFSILANSIYKLSEAYFSNEYETWFWAFKKKPTKQGVILFGSIMVAILGYSISLI